MPLRCFELALPMVARFEAACQRKRYPDTGGTAQQGGVDSGRGDAREREEGRRYLQTFLPDLPEQEREQHWELAVQDAPAGEHTGPATHVPQPHGCVAGLHV